MNLPCAFKKCPESLHFTLLLLSRLLLSKVNAICGGGQLLVSGSQGLITRVPGVRSHVPGSQTQGPSSRVPGSKSQSQVSGLGVPGLRVPSL